MDALKPNGDTEISFSRHGTNTMTASLHHPRLLAQRALLSRLNRKPNRKAPQAGFTLIELLITVVIIGILAAIAIPSFLNQQNKAVARGLDMKAMAAARSCAALGVTGETGSYVGAAGVTPETCNPSGEETVYTAADDADSPRASAAEATVTADGGVELTKPSCATGDTSCATPE